MSSFGRAEHYKLISENVYSIDVIPESDDKEIPHAGTGLALSDGHVLTSNHIFEGFDCDISVRLKQPKGDSFIGRIIDTNNRADLAMIETDDEVSPSGHIHFEEAPPNLGSLCLCGGYPNLIGETTKRRLRFARGMICSRPYGKGGAKFFEMDAMFNPGHSGSPVVEIENGKVIGIVCKSVGEVLEYFEKTEPYIRGLQMLSSDVEMLSPLAQAIDDVDSAIENLSYEIENYLGLEIGGGAGGSPDGDYEIAIDEHVSELVKNALNEFGVKTPTRRIQSLTGESHEEFRLEFSMTTLFHAIVGMTIKTLDITHSALDQSYQMGLGVVTGGNALVISLSITNSYRQLAGRGLFDLRP